MKNSWLIRFCAISALGGLSACASGGNGGSAIISAQPPTQTNPISCPYSKCLNSVSNFSGAYSIIRVTQANPSLTSDVDNSASASVNVSPGVDKNIETDDVYEVRYAYPEGNYSETFSNFALGSDAFGNYKTANNTGVYGNSKIIIYDAKDGLGKLLDFVQIAAFSTNTSSNLSAAGYIAYGNRTNAADMPTTGTAYYEGESRGSIILTNTNESYATHSKLTMNANFAGKDIYGSATDFKFLDANGQIINRAIDPSFNFTGKMSGNTFSANAGALNIGESGTVSGAFFGSKGYEASNVGLSYTIGNNGSKYLLLGAGGMGRRK